MGRGRAQQAGSHHQARQGSADLQRNPCRSAEGHPVLLGSGGARRRPQAAGFVILEAKGFGEVRVGLGSGYQAEAGGTAGRFSLLGTGEADGRTRPRRRSTVAPRSPTSTSFLVAALLLPAASFPAFLPSASLAPAFLPNSTSPTRLLSRPSHSLSLALLLLPHRRRLLLRCFTSLSAHPRSLTLRAYSSSPSLRLPTEATIPSSSFPACLVRFTASAVAARQLWSVWNAPTAASAASTVSVRRSSAASVAVRAASAAVALWLLAATAAAEGLLKMRGCSLGLEAIVSSFVVEEMQSLAKAWIGVSERESRAR